MSKMEGTTAREVQVVAESTALMDRILMAVVQAKREKPQSKTH